MPTLSVLSILFKQFKIQNLYNQMNTLRIGMDSIRWWTVLSGCGQQAQEFLKGLRNNHVRNCGFHARYILNLKQDYHSDDIHQALSHATRYHAFDAKSVERILKASF
jgi:hypothetical protein